MNKQQLKHLEEALREGTILGEEYSPTLPPPPDDSYPGPWEYQLSWYPPDSEFQGAFVLDLTLWSGYYCYWATRCQPRDEGWMNQEEHAFTSPFLSELFQQLEAKGIPLPTTHSPAQQVGTAAIARGTIEL